MSANHRLLLVHAHPDDESIGTGATMAKYVAEGAQVTLVTCTLGDEGEILIPELAHLAAHEQDKLAGHRLEELADAMAKLGVTDYRILGGIGAYRDSGMIGTPPNDRADSFWRADLLDAAKHLVRVIRETKPQVLVTYDDFGGYGHPDHIQAHRVATYAMSLAAVASFAPELGPAWQISKMYWSAFPVSIIRAGIEALKASGQDSGFAAQDPEDIPFACPDELISTVVDATDYVEQKFAALRAHATQISTEEGFFALSNNLGAQVMGFEYFRLAHGQLGPVNSAGHETDLFAGLDI